MESQPQILNSGIILKTFTHMYYLNIYEMFMDTVCSIILNNIFLYFLYLTFGFHGNVFCGVTVGVDGLGGVGGRSSSLPDLALSISFSRSSSLPFSNGFSSKLLCFIKLFK